MLDRGVRLSDTVHMTNNAVPAFRGRGGHARAAVSSGSSGGLVYDTLGMPMSLAAAKAMTAHAVQAALVRTLAQLHHESVSSIDATALIDSIEVVFLVGRYHKELGRKAPDLSKIDRARWSTLEGIAEVLHATTGALT